MIVTPHGSVGAFAERRTYPRYSFKKHLRLVVDGQEFHGRACDVSLGGMSLELWFGPSSLCEREALVQVDGHFRLGLMVAWRRGDRLGGPFAASARHCPNLGALIRRLSQEGTPI